MTLDSPDSPAPATAPDASSKERLGRLSLPEPLKPSSAWASYGGFVGAVLLWQIIAMSHVFAENAIPTPVAVAHDLLTNYSYYWTHAAPTIVTALEGFAVAAIIGVVVGSIGALTALTESITSRIGLALYCLPLPALLPLLSSVVAPGQQTRVVLATLFSFFPILLGVLNGFRAAPADTVAIVHCAGGGRLQTLARVGLRAALPQIMAGLRIAAPAALLGAIVAEFSGAQEGIGVALTVSQQKLHTTQTWGLAVVATLIGALMYLAVTAAANSLHVATVDPITATQPAQRKGVARRAADWAVPPLALIALWLGVTQIGASPLVMKSPSEVVDYLVRGPAAAGHRAILISDWLLTMQHTGIILGVGLAAALGASCLLITFPSLLRLSSPLLLVSQCVPQIAFIPLLVVICGRGSALIAVTGLLVVFFPVMVVMVTALGERSQSSLDLIHAYSGGRLATLWFTRLPGAIPGLLAAARLSIPLALFGALIAEWLVTGTGIANAMVTASVTFDYTRLWAGVATTTITVVALYALATALHDLAQRRFRG